jgi:zinc protease
MKYIQRILLVGLCLLFSGVLDAQEIPPDKKVRIGKLSNGFTYYLRSNGEPKKRALLYLVNNVGSVLEDQDQQGLAHFMEHMNFNGTRNFPKNALVDYLQKAGIRFGSDLNAHTGLDETVYELPVPTDDPKMILNGINIMRDWAQEATLDPEEINKERGVIIEEGRLAKGARERMSKKYLPMMLNYSIYASRMPIGKDSVLLNFQKPVIKRFFDDWYRPDLQALVVVGDIDVDQVEKLILAKFSDLKMPEIPRERKKFPIALTGKKQFIAVSDPEMSGTSIEVLFKHRAPELKSQADYLALMKRSLFAKLLENRRYAEISKQKKPAYTNMGLGIQPLMGGLDLFTLNTEAKEGMLKESFIQSWSILERIKRYGFSESELKQAKIAYLRGFESALNETDKTPSLSYVTEYKDLFLHGQAAPGIEWESNFVKQHISEIGVSDIDSVLNDYILNDNIDALVLSPDKGKSTLPDSAIVFSWMAEVSKMPIERFQNETEGLSLLSKIPSAGKVVSTKYINELGITTLLLSNGIKVILKPTDFKNDQIFFKGFRPGGTSLYSDKDFDNASNAAALISRFGLGDLSPVQLSQALNGKVVSSSAAIGQRSETVNGGSSKADLETALQLAYLQFTHPRKDSLIFVNAINSSKEFIRSRGADPTSVFSDTISSVMGNYSFRTSPPTIQRIEQISLDKVYQIYQDRFSDASGFTFVFVGSFDTEQLIPLIERYIASLPVEKKSHQAKDLGIHIPEGTITKKVYKGKENKASVRLVFSGNYQYSPKNNLLLKGLGDILQFKVLERLRETEGEVYSPSVQTSYNKNPKQRYAVTVSFGCAPGNVDHLISAVSEEMKLLSEKEIGADDIEKFKAAYQKNVELALKDNGFWLNYISGQYENNENILEVLDMEKNLNEVTPVNLKKTSTIFLSQKNMISFILLPEINQ